MIQIPIYNRRIVCHLISTNIFYPNHPNNSSNNNNNNNNNKMKVQTSNNNNKFNTNK